MDSDGTPFFSVVVPLFDGEATVADALGSLRRQDFPDWETVVVDDGSRDGSAAAAGTAADGDPRVRLLHHGENRGSGFPELEF